MGLKYKNCEIEQAPIGKILVYNYFDSVNEVKHIKIGYFYICKEQRHFNDLFNINCERDIKEGVSKWSLLPEFKEIDKEKPPYGKSIIVAWKTEEFANGLNHFFYQVFLDGQSSINIYYIREEKRKVTHWLEFEAFEEEKP